MTDDTFDHDDLEDALRRELHGRLVPFDPARAEGMIAAATSAEVRRLPRLAAPLGTAAAILALGVGVAVFAVNGAGGGNPAPAGGPKPSPTAKHVGVACVVFQSGSPGVSSAPSAIPTRWQGPRAHLKERLARQQMQAKLRKARHDRAGSVPPIAVKPLPKRVRAPLPAVAKKWCATAGHAVCNQSSHRTECVVRIPPPRITMAPSTSMLPRETLPPSVSSVPRPGAGPKLPRTVATDAPTAASASPSCTEPPSMPPCPSSR